MCDANADYCLAFFRKISLANKIKHVSKAAEYVIAVTEVFRVLEFTLFFFSASCFDSSSWTYWRAFPGCKLVEIWLCPTLYVYYWTCTGISLFIYSLLYSTRYALKYSAVKCWLLSDVFLLYYRDTARLQEMNAIIWFILVLDLTFPFQCWEE